MAHPVPHLTPYLVVSDAAEAVAFYQRAFAATIEGEAHLMPGTDKIMHVRLIVNGAMIMLADDFSGMMHRPSATPEALGGSPVTLALQMDDVQPFWDRAVEAGVTVAMPLKDMFWGDRYGQVVDPFGHKWSMSQMLTPMTDREMVAAAEEALAKRGTRPGDATGGG